MNPTHRTHHRKLADWFALLAIATLLLSGLALPAAQAAPAAPQTTTVIAALSDYGSGNALEQTVATMIAGWSPARIVTAGDNYHYQDCSTYATCVGNYYGSYVTAPPPQTFMPTMGNHDYDSAVGLTAWNNYFTWLPTIPDSQRRWYDFVVGDLHFFMLDGNGNQSTQSTWLSTAVPASTSVWNIAVIHQAPYSTGNYGDIAASQLPYGQYGIDFVISGHNHHYERLVKADGGKTVRYFIDGYGGSILSGSLGHSYCSYSTSAATSEFCLAETPGAMKITASDTSIKFEYYNSAGVVQNTYTQVIGPEITTSVGSLAPFNTTPGTPSAPQTYTVSGSDLTAGISINAPAGFEIKTDGAYGPSITLPLTGSVVNTTTISVRLTGAAGGDFSGDITHTSSGAAIKNVAVSGYVGSCPTVSLIVAEDTTMRSGTTRGSYNYGGSTTIRVNPYYSSGSTDGQLTGALLKWDFSSAGIPAGVTVSAASLTFNVTDGSNYAYGLYNMRRAWVEGSNDGATGSGASWNYYGAGTGSWGTTGAQNTSSDRYATNLWGATASNFNTTGSVTFDLNGSGVSVVQGWLAGSLDNYGLTIQDYSGTSTDIWVAASSEATTETNRPKLNITYCPSTNPTITTSGTLSPFSTTPGIPSAAQTYTVSGSNLAADISIIAPTGFQISIDGTNYYPSRTLTQSSGSVPLTTIYVRLTGAEGTFNDNITHTSTGAMARNVAVSGTASNCSTVNLVAAEDTYMSGYNTDYNYGGVNLFKVTNNSSGTSRGALIGWDVSSIPTNATISSASLTLYVSTASSQAYNLYNMRRDWVEGTLTTGASSTTSATWLTYNGTNTWGTSGAASTTSDRYNDNLWSTTTSTFTPAGSKTINLNTAGVSVIQGWIDGSLNNYGLTMQSYSSTSGSDDLQISSSENTTVENRPKLNVTYCVATGPTISTSGALSAFSSLRNVPSAVQNYTVSGGNLTENVVITAPSDFQISTTIGGPFGSSVSLTPDGVGTVAATPIYVRFLGATLGTTNGNITHTSAGAAPRNVPVSGTAVNGAPTVTLVQPVDNATGVSLPPTLQATVTDPDSDTMSVSFYGRPAGTAAADFRMVVIPDAQNYATSYATVYTNHLQWIATNKTSSNIVFATAVGDLVNTLSSSTEYTNADTAFDTLDAGGVSYSVGPGNHDMGTGSLYPTNFGTSRFSGKSYYGGSYDNYNNFYLFSASGMDFILINLQYSPTTAILDWADARLKQYSTRRAIVEQHDILNTNDSWVNQASYTALKDNPNLFLMLCGHTHAANDGAAYRAELGDDGHTIHVVMADYQDFAGSGYLRILRFSPADDMIYMTTSSPISGFSPIVTDPDQKNLAYDMASGAAFDLIGTVNGVASGSPASLPWSGRTQNTEYEWYAVVNDGTTSTTSATWSFTTGTTTVAVPKKPDVTSITQSSGNVVLAWNPVLLDIAEHTTTILKYQVYGSQDPYFTSGGSLLGEPTTTTFPHAAGSTDKTSWYYRVRAVNSAGPSDYSIERPGWFKFTLVPGS